MSLRTYSGPREAARQRSTAPAWVLVTATVAAQIAYPLVSSTSLATLTIVTVGVFFAASYVDAASSRGLMFAVVTAVVSIAVGLTAEAVGVRTGFPFGHYAYTGRLGTQLLGVPVVVPLAWAMMAYPALLVGRRIGGRFAPLVAAWALASWDVFLDPQMVAAGFWRWSGVDRILPGVHDVPLTNFLGWLGVSLVLMLVLHAVLPARRRASSGPPTVLYAWTWIGSVIGNATFFHRPPVALVGGVAMGLVAVPYLVATWAGRP